MTCFVDSTTLMDLSFVLHALDQTKPCEESNQAGEGDIF